MSKKTHTAKRHIPLVVGNWKMNPSSLGVAKKLFLDIRKGLGKKKLKTYVAIAAPALFISELEKLSPSQRIKLSAQDVFFETGGSYTGEISLAMLKSVGVVSVIIGHSERRALGDTNEEIQKNTLATIKNNMTAIVCIGEKSRDAQGNYFTEVETQLRSVLASVPKTKLSQLVLAYEPVWAIGTGNHATAEDVHEMKLFIMKVLSDVFGRSAVHKVRILYGGSVNAKNAQELLEVGNVDGFLVGGASLKASEFSEIIKTAEIYATS